MNVALARKLRGVAAHRRTITYAEVAEPLGLDMGWPPDRDALAGILGDISAHEHRNGRPLLTAVVVLAESGFPGGGFFDLARATGHMAAHEDRLACFVRELTAVHDYWASRRER
ncbi:MAG: hypothetical protein L6Q80_10280 [Dehalococcoidia bacterium]|nr:hypothetical protein [Dehalococcoidia bacterium]